MCVGEMQHIVEKPSRRATTLIQITSQSELEARSYEHPKSWESKPGQFQDSTLGVPGKKPFGCKCGRELQRILYGGRWWLPSSPGCGESNESKVARGLSQHRKCTE